MSITPPSTPIMARYFRQSRRLRRRTGVRWNVENKLSFGALEGSTQLSSVIVRNGADSSVNGLSANMTVKNFRVSVAIGPGSSTAPPGVAWALVYVPSGDSPSGLANQSG